MDYYYNFQNQIRDKKCFIWSSKHKKILGKLSDRIPSTFVLECLIILMNQEQAKLRVHMLKKKPNKVKEIHLQFTQQNKFFIQHG